ncbi:peptide chain release factor-like protein [Legionella sp. W05-934-2]|jgi:protein subunit release factor B|uniref:peptide chain release factor family protein n=1 Tax=Legionella sp. W05-934-2 TaxID=1198649 RepID=UPI003463777E
MITKQKWDKLAEWMVSLNISEQDILEKFIIGSGKGGQKLHKTASMVYIKYVPAGVEVKCQDSRSRDDNRYFARVRLCEKMDFLLKNEQSNRQKEIDKIRRQKKRRSRRLQKKILDDKQKRGAIKKLRKTPTLD